MRNISVMSAEANRFGESLQSRSHLFVLVAYGSVVFSGERWPSGIVFSSTEHQQRHALQQKLTG